MDSDSIRVYEPDLTVNWYPKKLPLGNSDIWRCSVGELDVFLHNHAKWQILRHAFDNAQDSVRIEVGGALIGGAHIDPEQRKRFVEITDAILGSFTLGTSARLTFTADTWSEIVRVAESTYPDKCIVGWYHTHPGWGIFLSDLDQVIQCSFFDQPNQVALVIDPIQKIGGFFHGTRKAGKSIEESQHFCWDLRCFPQILDEKTDSNTEKIEQEKHGLRPEASNSNLGGSRPATAPFAVTADGDMIRLTEQEIPPQQISSSEQKLVGPRRRTRDDRVWYATIALLSLTLIGVCLVLALVTHDSFWAWLRPLWRIVEYSDRWVCAGFSLVMMVLVLLIFLGLKETD